MSTKPTDNDLYQAARRIAATGQPVFPCRTEGESAKRPYTRNGFKNASTDPAQIKSWWSQYRGAAIGIPTGVQWDVLDVDVKNGVDGRQHLTRLQRLGLLNGCKRVVHSPSGGWHLYFTAAPGVVRNKSATDIGLDVRGTGGYVLAPPSFIDDGDESSGCYEDRGATTGSSDDPLLWDLIKATIAPDDEETKKPMDLLPSERRSSIAALREWVSNLQPNNRNKGLHWAVCRCLESGIDPHELVDAAALTGLPEEEILTTVRSAIRRAGLTVGDLDSEAEALFPGQ